VPPAAKALATSSATSLRLLQVSEISTSMTWLVSLNFASHAKPWACQPLVPQQNTVSKLCTLWHYASMQHLNAAPQSSAPWPRILAGAVIGSATGISAVLLYTNGLFVAGLTQDFGLTRTQFGLGVLLVTISLAIANPVVGWLVDRFGARRPSVAGLLLLAAGFAALGRFTNSVATYLLLQMLLALLGAACGPIAYTKLIGTTFTRHRGLALGLTMTGIGVGAALLPPLVARTIAVEGWRAGYSVLALVPLCGAVVTAVLLPRTAFMTPADLASAQTAPEGRPWLGSRTFWVLAATFALMSFSFGGLLPHFVPMLLDLGLTPPQAAGLAARIGFAVIASRMLVGVLLDQLPAPWVGIGICVIGASGGLLLHQGGVSQAGLTAIALGVALGAELDLLGFMVARYFPLQQFGRIYGLQYGAFILASGLGPLWVGALRDSTGSYSPALLASSMGLLLTCMGFLALPRGTQARV
jgi:hypothetical protein